MVNLFIDYVAFIVLIAVVLIGVVMLARGSTGAGIALLLVGAAGAAFRANTIRMKLAIARRPSS